jgi:hypothetical protein
VPCLPCMSATLFSPTLDRGDKGADPVLTLRQVDGHIPEMHSQRVHMSSSQKVACRRETQTRSHTLCSKHVDQPSCRYIERPNTPV